VKVPPEKSFRSRTTYANEALYVSKSATGYHFANNTLSDPNCTLRNIPYSGCSGNLVRQLSRVQSINHGFTINRVDANQFGQTSKIASLAITSPDIRLDFEYLLSDGYNEGLMDFEINGERSALASYIEGPGGLGLNFFITTVEEGHDVIGHNLMQGVSSCNPPQKSVIGIGNAHLTQYAVTAQVGQIPRARVSFDGFNMRSYTGTCNLPLPSLDPGRSALHGECSDVRFSIPDVYKSFDCNCEPDYMEHFVVCDGTTALRPGDILVDLQRGGLMSEQLSGFDEKSNEARSAAHIQGFTINIPLGNTRINRIGRHVEFARTINFPVNADIEINALVGNLRQAGVHADLWPEHSGPDKTCRQKLDLTFMFNVCGGVVCDDASSFQQIESSMIYTIKDAVLESEGFNSSVSDNKMVSLKFTAPIGSEDDTFRGFFISGRCHMDERPNILSFGQPLHYDYNKLY